MIQQSNYLLKLNLYTFCRFITNLAQFWIHPILEIALHFMKTRLLLLIGFIAFVATSIGWQSATYLSDEGIQYQLEKKHWVDSLVQTLPLEEKVAQFFMAAIYSNKDNNHKGEILNLVEKYNLGGLIFFQGTPTKQAEWANEFQAKAKTPLMVSIDGEWGINMRLDSTIKYPRQLTLGAIKDHGLIYQMGKRIAEECKAVGVNINLAPVMDINNNPNNPVINDRSFGEDKYNVALKSMAYAQGMQDVGVMAVGKHFPGHGDTDKDSHYTLPTITHDIERLKAVEFYPFQIGFNNGLMGIMAAHLHIPALDNTKNLAVSLSPKVTTHWLRDSLGFEGLVFSDALNMKGVSNYFAPGEVDKVAFMAGNDILLFSVNIPKGIALIKQAVETGEITEQYLNERLEKVLEYKYELGLNEKSVVNTSKVTDYLNNAEGLHIQKTLFEAAITLVNNEDNLVPLSNNVKQKVASLAIGKSGITTFQKALTGFDMTNFNISKELSDAQGNALVKTLSEYDLVIASVYSMSRFSSKNYGFRDSELRFLKKLNENTKVILVLYGSPYSLKYFDDFKNIIVAYEENELTETGVAKALNGKLRVDGKLPVSAGKYKFGQGEELVYEGPLMEYASPKDVKMNAEILQGIDALAQKAINIKATPGCQILVAKDGQIVYEKSFGKQKYEADAKLIDGETIYDLASITKVAATTLAMMKLYEDGKIDLEKPIKNYLKDYDSLQVGNLIIKDILAHEAGLPGWIPFYKTTLVDSIVNNWYQADSNEVFCVKVADDLFICKDSTEVIWRTIGGVTIKQNQGYKYSDLGFYLLKRTVEVITQMSFEDYLEKTFYQPMGLKNIGFVPYLKFDKSRIPPTENDEIFRKKEIKGYVHDQGAAMLGGVSGHAGLFSNAQDLAVVFQMLLNGGSFNGERYLQPSTINYFNTKHYKNNRRGLGFDKPEKPNGAKDNGPTTRAASASSFGHTGFTGTYAWADPEYNLVYIFLSNRTYPDAENKKLLKENIRTDIQKVIYEALEKVN